MATSNPDEIKELGLHPIEIDPKKRLSFIEAFFHVVKGCVGTGILALPASLKYSGLIGGSILIFICGMLIIHCTTMIVNVKRVKCTKYQVPNITYSETMKLAVKDGPERTRKATNFSPICVDFAVLGFQLGSCYIYVLFLAFNLKQIADAYIINLDRRIWIIILLGPLILMNVPRNLKVLAPISQVANVVMFTGLGIIIYFVFADLPSTADFTETPLTYATTYAMALFAFGIIPVALMVERDMREPERFVGLFGAFTIAITLITFLYMFMAFFGYYRYGDEILPLISLNIPQDSVLAHVVRGAYVTVIFLSYPLQFIVPFEILWYDYVAPKLKNPNLMKEYLFKFSLVLGTFILAVAVPLLEVFISFIGAVFLTLLSIIYPVILKFCMYTPEEFHLSNIILWKDLIVLVFGFVVLVAGTIICGRDIVNEFK